MKRLFTLMTLCCSLLAAAAQGNAVLEQLKADPKKAYGNDYPYHLEMTPQTKAPKGYEPFYISHYGRHGSRYYWTDRLYRDLDTLLKVGHRRHQLTAEGEAFYNRYMAVSKELQTGVSELTQLGWEQHQGIARIMYNTFPEVFKDGGNVLAIASLSGRCVLSMSAFCQELVQCNPKLEIREQSSRFTLDGVVPGDRQNPARRDFPKSKPRYEANKEQFVAPAPLREEIVARVFTSTDSLPVPPQRIGSCLWDLYSTLPSIGHEGLMGNILNDEEYATQWEGSNLGSYSWVFGPRYESIPILEDILRKAEDRLEGRSDRLADLHGLQHPARILP